VEAINTISGVINQITTSQARRDGSGRAERNTNEMSRNVIEPPRQQRDHQQYGACQAAQSTTRGATDTQKGRNIGETPTSFGDWSKLFKINRSGKWAGEPSRPRVTTEHGSRGRPLSSQGAHSDAISGGWLSPSGRSGSASRGQHSEAGRIFHGSHSYLVVDDSVVIRKLCRTVCPPDRELEVVG